MTAVFFTRRPEGFAKKMDDQFMKDIEHGHELTLEDYNNRSVKLSLKKRFQDCFQIYYNFTTKSVQSGNAKCLPLLGI